MSPHRSRPPSRQISQAASRSSTANASKKSRAAIPVSRQIVGWREWVSLPELGVLAIKAKIDTGARSSSLHAFNMETFRRRGALWVRFEIHPQQRTTNRTVRTEARVLEQRSVRSSNGHLSDRPVIVTPITLHGQTWEIELTLANRDEMGFRMLLGRQALRGRMLVDPARSFVAGKPPR